MTVPENQTSAQFTITTSPVSQTVNPTIIATTCNTVNATLTVLPPQLAGFSIAPVIVAGGSSATGTLTLSGPAPDGAVVTVTSDNPAVQPVLPVTVPADQTSTTFLINTSTVASRCSANLTAVYNATQNASLIISLAPSAIAQLQYTTEDTPVAITLSGSDPQQEWLSYAITSGPASGSLSYTATELTASGSLTSPNLTYIPTAGFLGTDSFTFTVTDSDGLVSASATVTIDIIGIPIAYGQNLQVMENSQDNPITLSGHDPEGLNLYYVMNFPPVCGTLDGIAPDLQYTPNAGFFGTDFFTYTVNNGYVSSSWYTVFIFVYSVPVAYNDSYTVVTGNTLSISSSQGVLANDINDDGLP